MIVYRLAIIFIICERLISNCVLFLAFFYVCFNMILIWRCLKTKYKKWYSNYFIFQMYSKCHTSFVGLSNDNGLIQISSVILMRFLMRFLNFPDWEILKHFRRRLPALSIIIIISRTCWDDDCEIFTKSKKVLLLITRSLIFASDKMAIKKKSFKHMCSHW